MVNFFKRIRYNISVNQQSSRYFRYAIGEILLIVIGILIALQINNWNEARKLGNRTDNYKSKLIGDIVQDTININEIIEYSSLAKSQIQSYFHFFEQNPVDLQTLIDSSKSAFPRYRRYFPLNYTFLDMQTSGNLGLLSDSQRRLLMELSNSQEYLQILIDRMIIFINEENHEMDKYLDSDLSDVDFFEHLSIKQNNRSLEQGLMHHHNMLTYRYHLANLTISYANEIKSKSKAALAALNEE